jgi:hypothetical protein
MLWYGSRHYDPELGRFISPDTIIPDPSNSQGWDRYAYTFNNPMRYVDPDGHAPCKPGYRCVTPIADQRDLTTWVVAAAVDIAESSEMNLIRGLNEMGSQEKAAAYGLFYEAVSDGAKYDVKDKILVQIGLDTKIGDGWYEYSTAGNILFGFYGKAAGFTEDELRVGAGTAQMLDYLAEAERGKGPCNSTYFCDTEVDYYAVGFGMYLYDNYYKDDGELTEEDLLDAFETYEDTDKMDIVSGPNDFRPRYHNYPANQFYQY